MAFGQQKNPLNNQGIHSAADGNRTRKIQRFYAVCRLRVAFRVACVAFLQDFSQFFRIFESNIKQKNRAIKPFDLVTRFSHWPTRRDSNPRPPESESVAISSFATDGNIFYKVYHKKNTVAIFITKKILTHALIKICHKKGRSKLRPFLDSQ